MSSASLKQSLNCWGVGGGRWVGTRENSGREEYRDGRRKGGMRDLYDGRKRERSSKKASFRCLLLPTSSQRNEPNNVSWLPFNVFRGLTQHFIHEKSQETKIRTRDKEKKKKKQHYFLWNWRLFQASYVIKHGWDCIWHMYTCVDCAGCVSVSSVSQAVEILRKNDKASKVKCRQRPF